MFVVNGDSVYKITRKSAKKNLGEAIEIELKQHFCNDIVPAIVTEIKQNIQFPSRMDDNVVFVYFKGKFKEYMFDNSKGFVTTGQVYDMSMFKPEYKGPAVPQIERLLEYPLEQMLEGQEAYTNALIVQINKNEYDVTSMSDEIQNDISKALKKLLVEEKSNELAASIAEKMYANTVLMTALIIKNDRQYFALREDGNCKKMTIFKTSELYKLIMSKLPNLDTITKKVKRIATYLHNYIMYGFPIDYMELANPVGFKGKKALFKRIENGRDFFLQEYGDEFCWVSDYIKVRWKDLEATTDKQISRELMYKGMYTFSPYMTTEYPKDGTPVLLFSHCSGPDCVGLRFLDKDGKTCEERYACWKRYTGEVYVKIYFREPSDKTEDEVDE